MPTIVALMFVALFATASRMCAAELSETEQRLLADAADNSLDEFSLLEGALIASGVTDCQRVERYCSEFAARTETIGKEADDNATAAEELYRALHRDFLTGEYHSTCTEIERALDDGDYNCVTATVLYHCICRTRGLSPIAVATDTHVRSQFVDDRIFDVETTCPEWFDLMRRNPQSQKSRMARQTTRPLSDVELLAKIYYNRGVSRLEAKAFSDAIELLAISQSLDAADAPTRENIAAGLNNWALAECDAGNFARANELLQNGWRQYPEFAAFAANDVHIHQRWAVALCEEGRFDEAMQALQAAYLRRPDVALFDRGRWAVYGQWSASCVERGDLAGANRLTELATNWFKDPSDPARSCRADANQE